MSHLQAAWFKKLGDSVLATSLLSEAHPKLLPLPATQRPQLPPIRTSGHLGESPELFIPFTELPWTLPGRHCGGWPGQGLILLFSAIEGVGGAVLLASNHGEPHNKAFGFRCYCCPRNEVGSDHPGKSSQKGSHSVCRGQMQLIVGGFPVLWVKRCSHAKYN